jgi:phosphoadenosine phosphosulfate reductase
MGTVQMPTAMQTRFRLHGRKRTFQMKVFRAEKRVTQWLEKVDTPYIAFSGGKDSHCVLHLVRAIRPGVQAVYFDADCTFPECDALIDATENCIRFPAAESFLDTLKRVGIDAPEIERVTMETTVYQPIRALLTRYGFNGVAYGLRAEESRGRRIHAGRRGGVFQYQSGHNTGLWGCQPLYDWFYDDVWAYIVMHKIPYCQTYNRLWEMPEPDRRISYWAGESNRSFGRYAWLKRNYPELFNRLAQAVPEVRRFV